MYGRRPLISFVTFVSGPSGPSGPAFCRGSRREFSMSVSAGIAAGLLIRPAQLPGLVIRTG